MTYTIKKQQLETEIASTLQQLNALLASSPSIQNIEQLLADIKNDYYTIVVVGEFKHGKSTLVNALLEESLMPVDVTPTTATINAVFYGQNRELHVVGSNGDIERSELSENNLSNYIASADFNPNDIKYLKMFLPSPLLKNRVVLVDTPGVNDLNQHRSEITHQFIPRADAVIFMVDMRAPINKTEQKFLQQITSKEGIKRIIFAANFIDRIDEEEIDEVVEFIESRVQSIIKGDKPKVYPLSALEGLHAKLEKDEVQLELSGLKPLEQAIYDLLESGTRSIEKLERYTSRINQLFVTIQVEIETVQHFSAQSIEQLEGQLAGILQWFNDKNQWYAQVDDYIDERSDEMKNITGKSIDYFSEQLKKDIANRIELFHGGDMKHFMETQLPLAIKSQFEQWVNQYGENIRELFMKLENEVSKGLSRAFQQTIKVSSVRHSELETDMDIPLIKANTGNSSVKAGLLVGEVSTIALLLGGTFFIPIVGMAGLPFLQSKIAEKQMKTIKPALHQAMDEQLSLLINNFASKVNDHIEKNVIRIRQNAIQHFERQVEYLKISIDDQINDKKRESNELESRIDKLTSFAERLKRITERCGDK